MPITNPKIQAYRFLSDMYADTYYPDFLVDEVRDVLLRLCEQIEAEKSSGVEGLYLLTHQATRAINELADQFLAYDSEIETMARDTIGRDFAFIAGAYGYGADPERLISPRNW